VRKRRTYPVRSLTLVVPFPPGGSTDGPRLASWRSACRAPLGQPIVIENVGGAGGKHWKSAASSAVSAPDGYTFDNRPMGYPCRAASSTKLDYDLEKDLEPIAPDLY